uniref:EOG090X0B8X n=1 Tax=Evadne anonyx TaxID=141404 RepID=A0A9N6ZF60_9CRUS|nr:EOG090X0B8X [Evadne anonyx]
MAKITLFSFLVVLCVPVVLVVVGSELEGIEIAHVYADVGSNISLPCMPQSSYNEPYSFPLGKNSLFVWIREGKSLQHSRVDSSGVLLLSKIAKTDSGIYTCQIEKSVPHSEHTYTTTISRVQLHVKTTPPSPIEMHVYPTSNLALAMWQLNGTGGYPIKFITVIYQEITDDPNNPSWHRTYPDSVGPEITQLNIYRLQPNTTYRFRVWATNKLGPGDYAEFLTTTKLVSSDEVQGSHLIWTSRPFHMNPWILCVGVFFGSMAVAVMVLTVFVTQTRRSCFRRRSFHCLDDMELVTNIITNPNYIDNDTTALQNDECNDLQALLKHPCSVNPSNL